MIETYLVYCSTCHKYVSWYRMMGHFSCVKCHSLLGFLGKDWKPFKWNKTATKMIPVKIKK
jgi:hypothetical protein